MSLFADLIDQFLDHGPQLKSKSNFLSIKNGFLPIKVGFYDNPEAKQKYPTLLIDSNLPTDHFSVSSSYPVTYSLANMIDVQKKGEDNHITDDIIQQSIRSTSLKVCQNKNNQLTTIEDELGDIIQTGTVDVSTFSNNCITNVTEYDIEGNPIGIKNAIIDPEVKKYVEIKKQQMLIFDNIPHPIRKKKKVKNILNIEKKSARQILDEFQIINALFSSKTLNQKQQGSDQKLEKMLECVGLNDNSYQELWEKIIGEIKITKEHNNTQNKTAVSERMNDQEFDKAIDRIVKEAVEYEKQAMEIKDKEEVDEGEDQQNEVEVIEDVKVEEKNEMKEEEKATDFQKAKIDKKVQHVTSSKYQYAIQDNSDLTNFYDVLPKENFACPYKFELDQFQKRSILHLQNKESIFVAAHTSAGKTVVAEYGVALAIKHKRKVIYTSPIKALSNQKYRQLSLKFGAEMVGIVTGDVSMNQQANCVIMTTQILRNNLYRGAEMVRDIEWVIFDEVHYINNQERGVVWQQTIIMLPQHIGIIMLSATVPNYMDFANWVGRTKRRIIYVMKTLHRPVPLEHSLYIFNKFHVIKEANGRFLKQQYNDLHHQIKFANTSHDEKIKAMKEMKKKKIQDRGFFNDNRREQITKLKNKNAVDKFIKNITRADMETAQGREQHRVLQQLIVDCNKKKLLPCVVFTFSKKKINSMAAKIYTYDLTNHAQKSRIVRMISSALSNLKPQDQQIDQFRFIKQLCINGYAVHHGDLLPLAKQIVQLLFSEGLIKVLFATETFAMGINMPTKTVIFNSIKKVTGSQGILRFLNSSEYVQMSGRAGRRGLDQKGTVIIIVKDPQNLPQATEMEKMVDHPGQRLQSKFKVTYQIILNLLNSTDFGVTEMMRQSFLENPKFSEFTSNIKSLKQYQNEYQVMSQFDCPFNKLGTRLLMDQYMSIGKKLKIENQNAFYQFLGQPKNQKGALLPKFAKILGHNNETQIGLVLRIDDKKARNRFVQVLVVNKQMIDLQVNKQDREAMQKELGIKKKVILEYDQDKTTNIRSKFYKGQVPGTKNLYYYYVHWLSPELIVQIYSNKVNTKFTPEQKKQDFEQLSVLLLKIPDNLTPYGQGEEKQLQWKLFTTSQCHECEFKQKHQHQYERRNQLKNKLTECAKRLELNELGLMSNFEGMLLVLTNFGFINTTIKEDNTLVSTLTLKGRIAKEVDIFVAQIIVQGILQPLDSAEIPALLSAFVCDFKPRLDRNSQQQFITPIPKQTNFTDNLTKAIGKTLRIVQQIAAQQQQLEAYMGLNSSSMQQHILSIVNFHLSDTVYKWAIGYDFVEARIQSKAPEGIIVRTIMRLSQLLANAKSVCRIIGNSQLQNKIDESLQNIKRDIVFCQSLYLTG